PDLALQLKMYKEFVDASHWIEGKWETNAMFGRERAKTEYKKSFLPPARIGEEDLRVAFRSVLRRLEPFYALREAAV
ncbi:TPA: hypothetical protein DCZ32_02415, partial [Candidatus Uhrbacteria bacterium]|nr:hypothetical protein [Candidatus Uhrbacteria bacterium]